ncbi:MAG TPA: pilus assembly protein PilM [Noviherbaspirillum sp.]|nr:pilus assembly protein PilM [Noviherbaspirillum sp.]
MALFPRKRALDGWMAFDFLADGIAVVYVRRAQEGPPVVEAASFHRADRDALGSTLLRLQKELHADRHRCTSLLGAGDYQLVTVEAPNVAKDELKVAVRWRIKDLLDFHIDDATIDVLDIPVDKNAAARGHSMYVVAARNQLIQQRQGLFETAKIPLSVIDIPEMAQRNLSELVAADERGVAMLSFGSAGGLLTVTFKGELYLSRRIDITTGQLQEGAAEQKSALHDRITLELQRSLDHFDRQYHFITVSKLMLAPMGDGSALKDYLAANLYLPVEEFVLGAYLDVSKVQALQDVTEQQRFLMALGAGLRNEEKVL